MPEVHWEALPQLSLSSLPVPDIANLHQLCEA